MSYTIAEMVRKVGKRLGVRVTQDPIGSSDFQLQQLVELFNEEVYETGKYRWQALIKEATFVTVAQEDQGKFIGDGGILTDADQYNYILSDTMWDRTARQPVIGPNSSMDWQTKQAVQYTSGPYPDYRIRNNRLLFLPIPAAGNNVYFEFASKQYVYDPDADTYGAEFTDNDQVTVLDADLIMQGVRWRWKMAKGFPYQEEKRIHELDVLTASSRDSGNRKLNLGGGNSTQLNRAGDLTSTEII